jgi:bacillithiol biosynthesis deacetylase BshB1
MIRKYQPEIVFANAIDDRHSDHGRASFLTKESCFLAGLEKVETFDNGEKQAPWRPKVVYHYIQSIPLEPDFIVDVSEEWEVKMNAVKAFKTQFFNPDSAEPETYISNPRFMEMIHSRGTHYGHEIGVQYGEGFTVERKLGVNDITSLL